MNCSFFQSVPFGIIAMILVGSSWTLSGLVLGIAPRHGLTASSVKRMGGLFSLAAGVAIMAATRQFPHASIGIVGMTVLLYGLTGFLSGLMSLIMSLAMQYGPNGIIWSIVQSGTICSFIGGILFFGLKATPLRVTGIFLILVSLALFGHAKDNTIPATNEPLSLWGWKCNWRQLAFLCFALVGLEHNITTIPSFFEDFRRLSPIFRSLCAAAGNIAATIFWSVSRREPHPFSFQRETLHNRYFWIFVLGLQFFGLLFSYTLLYPGLDILGKAGLSGTGFPLMVGSCCVAFTITSRLLLKEVITFTQLAALSLCIIGLICLISAGEG